MDEQRIDRNITQMIEKSASEPRLAMLAGLLMKAKAAETNAKKTRIKVEEEITSLMFPGGMDSDKGSQQKTTSEDGFKLVTKCGVSYKADLKGIAKALSTLNRDGKVHMPTKTTPEKTEFCTTAYEWYRNNDPEVFSLIFPFVTVTPKKPNVTVSKTEE